MALQKRPCLWLGWLLGGAVALFAAPHSALAFCRATTCNEKTCPTDSKGCAIQGTPLAWASSCITLNLQSEAAPSAGVSYDEAKASLQRAAEAWMSVDCPEGGHPSIDIKIEGAVMCAKPEYNRDGGNANVLMFREDEWPYEGRSADALGFTNLSFDPDTGALFDADIELNAIAEPLAVGRLPKAQEADLDSVLTHELGHLLGLGHSLDVAATMVSGYANGTYELRTPAPDDVAGICAIYPPRRRTESTSCEPRHGFSELCGADQTETPNPNDEGPADVGANDASCSFIAAPNRRSSALGSFLLLGACGVIRRRAFRAARRPQRHGSVTSSFLALVAQRRR